MWGQPHGDIPARGENYTSFVPFVIASMALVANDGWLMKSLAGFAGICVVIGLFTAFLAG